MYLASKDNPILKSKFMKKKQTLNTLPTHTKQVAQKATITHLIQSATKPYAAFPPPQ